MSIVKFENVKITTMTAIANLEGSVIIESIFPLLPITRLNLDKFSRTTKKFKIPWPGSEYAGSIFSAKFSGITRGIIKSNSDKSFRNCIVIDICTSEKNISAKLVKNKIHMCGPNSLGLAKETAEHIISHLSKVQDELDYMTQNPRERDEAIRWLKEETRGEKYTINEETQEIVTLKEGEKIYNSVVYDENNLVKYIYREVPFSWEEGDMINQDNIICNKMGEPYHRSLSKKEKKDGGKKYPVFQIGEIVKLKQNTNIPVDERGNAFFKVSKFPLRVVDITSVKFPDFVMKKWSEGGNIFPEGINSRIAGFLLTYIQDYAYHHVLCEFFDGIREISRVYTTKKNTPLKLGDIDIAMINYSYSLMMNVDRWALAQLIDGYEGFRARYDNTTDHHVTVTLPYEKDKDETIKRKGTTVISWMIYKSGIVTQSGPSAELMAPSYYKFMNFIESVRDKIMLKDGKPFNIKYKRIPS